MCLQPHRSVDDFRLSLAQTKGWCVGRIEVGNAANCLRSPELRQALRDADLNTGYWQDAERVSRLINYRTRLARSFESLSSTFGRLLCCDVAASEASEASHFESEGYFDYFDVPPWDTWVAWFSYKNAKQPDNGYLIAWVPPEFVAAAQRGIDANPVECIFWAGQPPVVSQEYSDSIPDWFRQLLVESNETET